MNVLYIGNLIDKVKSGADAVNKRNLEFLDRLSASQCLVKSLKINTLTDKVRGYIAGLTPSIEREIMEVLTTQDIDIVFISHSLLGRICKKIKVKYPKIKIVTFFHNVEVAYARAYYKSVGLKGCFFYFLAKSNERYTIDYSDINIVLNKRDQGLLGDIYNKKADLVMPVSYRDSYGCDGRRKVKRKGKFKILFVGVAFFANVDGINWFLKNIMPHVDVELSIVGSGMDKAIKVHNDLNVSVYGYVESLSEFYIESDLVIAPIFTGGGMKTKIAEAMMYGKGILGTKEAFEGYELVDGVHFLFSSQEECLKMLKRIIADGVKPFEERSRNAFIENYSNEVVYENFSRLLVQ